MSPRIGRDQVVGLGLQPTRGTGVTADYWVQKTAFEFNREVVHIPDVSALGVSAGSQGVQVARQKANASLEGYVELSAQGLLEWAAGESYSDTLYTPDVSNTVYEHVSKGGIKSTNERFLTINVEDTNLEGDQDVIDSMLQTLTVNFDMDSIVNFVIEFIGKYPETGSNTSAFTTPTNFMGRHITIKVGDTVTAALASSAIPIKSGVITRNFNVNDDPNSFVLGDKDVADHHKQDFTAEITLEKFLENQTFIDRMKDGDHQAVVIDIQNTDITIGTSTNPFIRYIFPRVSYQDTVTADNSALRAESLVLMAHYGEDNEESASYLWKSVIRNLVVDYEA